MQVFLTNWFKVICNIIGALSVVVILPTHLLLKAIPVQAAPIILFQDDFETGNFSKWNETEPGMDSIISTGCAQGTYCHKRVFPSDAYDAMWAYTSQQFSQAYISYYQKLSSNFTFGYQVPPNPAGGDHFWRLITPGSVGQMDIGWETNMDFNFYMNSDVEYRYVVPQSKFKLGQWQHVEFFIKLNTQPEVDNASDGILKMWIDGELVLNRTDAYMQGTPFNLNFNQFSVTNYNPNGPGEETGVYWIFDDINILSDMPSADTTPPAAVTDLQAQ
jgi:hypothetical protein